MSVLVFFFLSFLYCNVKDTPRALGKLSNSAEFIIFDTFFRIWTCRVSDRYMLNTVISV